MVPPPLRVKRAQMSLTCPNFSPERLWSPSLKKTFPAVRDGELLRR